MCAGASKIACSIFGHKVFDAFDTKNSSSNLSLSNIVGPWCVKCKSHVCSHSPERIVLNNNVKYRYTNAAISDFFVQEDSFSSKKQIKLYMMSFNCLSMLDGSNSISKTNKAISFKGKNKQLKGGIPRTLNDIGRIGLIQENIKDTIHVCGFQETRTAYGIRKSSDFVCFASGSNKGALGVELWFNCYLDIYYADVKTPQTHKFDPTKFVECAATPRLLLVSYCIGETCLWFLSAHAPDRCHGIDVIKKWWDDLDLILSKHKVINKFLYVFIDTNGTVGSVVSESIGPHGAGIQNMIGERFHKFLISHQLIAPVTFEHLHDRSPHHTFTHNKGSKFRLDFVVVPIACAAEQCCSGTLDDLDIQITLLDHVPTYCNCFADIDDCSFTRKKKLDFRKLVNEDNKEQYRSLLSNCSFDLPFFDSTSLVHYKNMSCAHCFENIPSNSPVTPYRQHISTDTLKLASHKKHIRCAIKVLKGSNKDDPCIKELSTLYKQYVRLVRKSSFSDKQNRIENLTTAAQDAYDGGNFREFHNLKRKMTFVATFPSTSIIDDDGNLYDDYFSVRSAFQGYFAELMDGDIVEYEDALRDYRSSQTVDLKCKLDMDVDAFKMNKLPNHRAAGIGDVTYEFYKAFADILGIPLAHLTEFIKLGDIPFHWCLSILHELYKGKNGKSRCANFRDILLADCGGKIVKRMFRSCCLKYIDSYILDTQCGGFLKRGTDFCSHFLRTKINIARNSRSSISIFFLDVSSAFATVVRYFITGQPISDTQIAMLFKNLGFSTDVYAEFHQNITHNSALFAAGMPPDIIQLVSKMVHNTYFHIRGTKNIVDHNLGTGAGNPLADLMFTFLITRVLRRCNEELIAAGLCVPCDIPTNSNIALPNSSVDSSIYDTGTSYVDDCLFYLMMKCALQLIRDTSTLIAIVIDVFATFGLKLNFKIGKSNVMIKVVGRGSKSIMNEYFGGKQTLTVISRAIGLVEVFVCKHYKHVGSMITVDNNMNPEATYRVAAADCAYYKAAPFLKSKNLNIKSKVYSTATLVFSCLFYNAASVHAYSKISYEKIRCRYYRYVRTAHNACNDKDSHITDAEVINKYNVYTLEAYLMKLRIKYFIRFTVRAPLTLRLQVAIEHDRSPTNSWISLIMRDFDSIRLFFSDMPSCNETIPFITYILDNTKDILNIVNKHLYHLPVIDKVRSTMHDGVKDELFTCNICGDQVYGSHALGSHKWKIHRIKNEIRRHCDGSVCYCCLVDFRTRQNLIHHYYRSKKCKAWVLVKIPPLSTEQQTILDADDAVKVALLKRHLKKYNYTDVPSYKTIGPLPRPLTFTTPCCSDAD